MFKEENSVLSIISSKDFKIGVVFVGFFMWREFDDFGLVLEYVS